jgi:hypothetical protein
VSRVRYLPDLPEGSGAGASRVLTTVGRSQDMAEKVAALSGAIGYTELNMAEKASLRMASIRNAEGEFTRPSARSIAATAKTLTNGPTDDFRISLTNAAGKDSYPISSFHLVLRPSGCQGFRAWPRCPRVFAMGILDRREARPGTRLLAIARRPACQSDGQSGDHPLMVCREN